MVETLVATGCKLRRHAEERRAEEGRNPSRRVVSKGTCEEEQRTQKRRREEEARRADEERRAREESRRGEEGGDGRGEESGCKGEDERREMDLVERRRRGDAD